MPHCTNCGSEVDSSATFCPKCGKAQTPASSPAPSDRPSAPENPLPNENIAGLLCYVVGWITGLIFYFTDKRPFVRFHAAQSIIVFGGLNILQYLIGILFGFRMFGTAFGGSLAAFWLRAIDLFAFLLWILCMFKAYQGIRFRVPIAADIAERIFWQAVNAQPQAFHVFEFVMDAIFAGRTTPSYLTFRTVAAILFGFTRSVFAVVSDRRVV